MTDPQTSSGINNMPFHRHQQDDTLAQYMALPLSLLGMLIRPKKKYQLSLLKTVE